MCRSDGADDLGCSSVVSLWRRGGTSDHKFEARILPGERVNGAELISPSRLSIGDGGGWNGNASLRHVQCGPEPRRDP